MSVNVARALRIYLLLPCLVYIVRSTSLSGSMYRVAVSYSYSYVIQDLFEERLLMLEYKTILSLTMLQYRACGRRYLLPDQLVFASLEPHE